MRIKDLRSQDLPPELNLEELQKLQLRLQTVSGLLELLEHPSWPLFETMLRNEENAAIEMLISGEGPSRERIRHIRHLLELPENLEAERARLTAVITAQQEA